MLVQLHRPAVALPRRFSVRLHTLPLCGHGSDSSKLLLGGKQATSHEFSWHYYFSWLKTLADFFFFPTEFKGAWGSPISANAKPWEGRWKPKPLKQVTPDPDIARAPRALLGGMLLIWWEEGALGLPRVLPAGMWTGYSQLLRCSREKMRPGSPRVTTPKVVQSRAPRSKRPEAEMGKGLGGGCPQRRAQAVPAWQIHETGTIPSPRTPQRTALGSPPWGLTPSWG